MKVKQLLFGGVLFAAFSITAMQSKAQVEVGVRAGVNFSNVTAKDEDGDKIEDNKILPGFHAGLTFDIPVADEFYVQPGALFSTKGSQFKDGDESGKTIPYYVEVPINFLYKPALGSGNLLLGVGPYVAYGLGGKWKDKYDGKTESGKLVMKNSFDDDDNFDEDEYPYTKPLDLGGNLLVGYEFSNKFSAQLNAQLGMLNIAPKYNGEKSKASVKNVGFGVSLGYKF